MEFAGACAQPMVAQSARRMHVGTHPADRFMVLFTMYLLKLLMRVTVVFGQMCSWARANAPETRMHFVSEHAAVNHDAKPPPNGQAKDFVGEWLSLKSSTDPSHRPMSS